MLRSEAEPATTRLVEQARREGRRESRIRARMALVLLPGLQEIPQTRRGPPSPNRIAEVIRPPEWGSGRRRTRETPVDRANAASLALRMTRRWPRDKGLPRRIPRNLARARLIDLREMKEPSRVITEARVSCKSARSDSPGASAGDSTDRGGPARTEREPGSGHRTDMNWRLSCAAHRIVSPGMVTRT